MSVILQNCAGSIHVFSSGGASGDGFGLFKLNPSIPSGAPNSMCFIDSIPLSFREIAAPVVTLDDSKFIYVYGSAWTEATITGRLLLGQNGGMAQQLGNLRNWYGTNRISQLQAPIQASAGVVPLKAFVVGLAVGPIDPNIYVQQFAISAVVNFDIT